MRALAIAGLALALAGCTTASVQTAAQDAEKADTAALTLYAATAGVLNVLEQAPGVTVAQVTKYEAIRTQAWNDLATVNMLYKAGKAIDLSPLEADHSAAQALASPNAGQ